MLRALELGWFFVPFVLYATWLFVGRRLSTRFMVIAVGCLVTISVATVWYGLARSLPPADRYVPAHMENGRIVPGRGVAP